MSRPTNEWIALILTVATSASILALVGSATYAVVVNTNDWVDEHIPGPNLTTALATLIGSLLSATIAGVVGYISGTRTARRRELDPGDGEPKPPA